MGLLTYNYQQSRGQSKGNGFVFGCLRVTGTILDCSFRAGILALPEGEGSVSVLTDAVSQGSIIGGG